MLEGLAASFSGMNGPAQGNNNITYLRPTDKNTDSPPAPSLVSAVVSGSAVEVKIAAGFLLVCAGGLVALHMWTRGHQL